MDEADMDNAGTNDEGGAEIDGHTDDGASGGDGPAGFRRLRRSRTDRMLGGVCGGLGEYLRVDPVIVRIAFVLLTLVGGVGLVLYGAGWLLMSEREERPVVRELFGGSRRHQVIVAVGALLVGAVTVAFISHGPFWVGSTWRAGQALGWIAIAGVVGYLLLRGARGPYSLARLVRRVAVGLAGLVVVAVVVTIGAELATGVPLSGGYGSRTWRPTSSGDVVRTYRVGVGNGTLDLRTVAFPDRVTRITASVGIGRLLVEVPPGVTVSLDAHSGIGGVSYGGGSQSTFLGGSTSGKPNGTQPTLVLDAQAGLGEVELVRGAPDAVLSAAPSAASPPLPCMPVGPGVCVVK